MSKITNRRVSNDVIAEVLVQTMQDLSSNIEKFQNAQDDAVKELKYAIQIIELNGVKVNTKPITNIMEQYKGDFSNLNEDAKAVAKKIEEVEKNSRKMTEGKIKIWRYYLITSVAFVFCIILAYKTGKSVIERDQYKKQFMDTEWDFQRYVQRKKEMNAEMEEFFTKNPKIKKKWDDWQESKK